MRVGVAGLWVAVAVGAKDGNRDSGAKDNAANVAGCVCAAVGGALLCASRTSKAIIATKTSTLSCRVFMVQSLLSRGRMTTDKCDSTNLSRINEWKGAATRTVAAKQKGTHRLRA
jgi:hypothetical protein